MICSLAGLLRSRPTNISRCGTHWNKKQRTPTFPFLLAEPFRWKVFDPPIFAALCSGNLTIAASRLAKYKKLIGPMRLSVTQSEHETTLQCIWPHQVTPPQTLTITELVFWVALARLATRTNVRPLRATAPDPPQDAAAYREYLGIVIKKGPAQTVTFSAQDATRPFLTANEPMWEFFEPELRKRLWELQADSSMAERVHGALVELLPAGEASMSAVAGKLAVSSRTLQRRLYDEGTTFKALLTENREALAKHYLSNSNMTASEISFLLGYEDANSFYRAFPDVDRPDSRGRTGQWHALMHFSTQSNALPAHL